MSGKHKVCVIFGDPVAHSLSPAFHHAGHRALGLEEEYTFIAARVAAADLPKAMTGARAMNLHAITITMPHKEAVVRLLDGVDGAAQQIGAVNSIINREGRLIGYNTDWIGITKAVKRRTSIAGARVVVLGAGGTARAAVFGLIHEGAAVTVLNRSVERGEALAREFGCRWGALTELECLERAEIIVQTTAVGLNDPAANPAPDARFRSGQVVVDVIYRPVVTPFLAAAERAGAQIVRGEEVFIEQGLAQFELYTGEIPPREPLAAVVRSAP